MSEYDTIARRYIDTWNEQDPERRKKLIEDLYTADATYTDPLAAVSGPAGIDEFVAGAQQQFAGLSFALGPVDGHHDIARFTWYLGTPDAEPVVVGFDVIAVTDGRIARVSGFLDKVPA
ncbi:nuclear transport factor 2 family protein [Nocardia terpenica]|uniref:Nuclear transport factor 2 family protein n=1 Tax=Nocardia terpenica TaxID=455432 RepID=A0A6G9Z2M6_9NOCA|nr:nuclear transport factor 2 family protein [Nocardia terpenica]QIS19859.1 nuclear transport factor 2 family protein [Nocardia terpenica]